MLLWTRLFLDLYQQGGGRLTYWCYPLVELGVEASGQCVARQLGRWRLIDTWISNRGVSMKRYMRSIDRRTNILVLTKTSNSSNIGLLKGGFDCIDTRRGSYCSVSSWRVSLWIIASSTVWFYKIGATRRSIWWSLNSTMRPAELIHQINRWLNIAYRIERHYGEGKMWKIWGNSGRWNKTCAW